MHQFAEHDFRLLMPNGIGLNFIVAINIIYLSFLIRDSSSWKFGNVGLVQKFCSNFWITELLEDVAGSVGVASDFIFTKVYIKFEPFLYSENSNVKQTRVRKKRMGSRANRRCVTSRPVPLFFFSSNSFFFCFRSVSISEFHFVVIS